MSVLDPGMDRASADELEARVAASTKGAVAVVPDGDYFVVTVSTATGTWTLTDEADFEWLRDRISRGSTAP